MYRYVFFDFDGTLTDSSEGILHSLRYALEKMGTPPLPPETEKLFIGPPLQESFALHCGYTPEQVVQAIHLFREYYCAKGITEMAPIPGMEEALRHLQDRGLLLAVTSSKEHNACCQAMENLGLAPFFAVIAGSESDLSHNTKADIIRSVMEQLHLTEENVPEILLVGDRKYDVIGAAQWGIPCLGVDFCGFAPEGELTEAGAVAVVHTAEEMADYILA